MAVFTLVVIHIAPGGTGLMHEQPKTTEGYALGLLIQFAGPHPGAALPCLAANNKRDHGNNLRA